MKGWKTVKLCELARQIDRAVASETLGEVNLAGVYSFGRGLFRRGPMTPGETSYKYYNRLVEDDFVISLPKGWEGAIARVTPEFDGWYLSPVFPAFRCDESKLLPGFLEWFCKLEPVWAMLLRNSRGIGARRETVSPATFLALEIPLPPLSEQRRIVARIEALAAKIAEARRLRQEAVAEAEACLVSMAHRADLGDAEKTAAGWKFAKLSECVAMVSASEKVDPAKSYPNLGIYSFGRGLFRKPDIDGLATSAPSLRRVSPGQFIYSRLFAFEGAYGMVTEEFEGSYVSQEYPTFECRPDVALPEFLVAYFKPEMVWKSVALGSKGLGDRRQRVQPPQLLNHALWVPPIEWQRRLATTSQEVDRLKRLQSGTAAELDALLPAILDRAFKGGL